MRSIIAIGLALCGPAFAQIPDILIEACSLLDSANKRVECLRVASQSNVTSQSPVQTPKARTPSYLVAPVQSNLSSSASNSRGASSSSSTCYTGPRGGTYTITKSGRKNYGGC